MPPASKHASVATKPLTHQPKHALTTSSAAMRKLRFIGPDWSSDLMSAMGGKLPLANASPDEWMRLPFVCK